MSKLDHLKSHDWHFNKVTTITTTTLTSEAVYEILSATTEMKATEQYLPVVVSFIMLYKVILTFEFVDEILKCYHSNETTEQYLPVVLFISRYGVV